MANVADIVGAAIAVGVRVERTVQIRGGHEMVRELVRAGGTLKDGTASVYTGVDCDGVEWSIAVLPGSGGLSVVGPATPGGAPVELARFAAEEDARAYAAHLRARRPDLRSGNGLELRAGDARTARI